jgi:hypothetical protein
VTTHEILRRRLAGQMLVGKRATTARDVVRRLGAVQAQEYGPTKWSLAMRTRGAGGSTPGLLDAEVEKEVNDGRILRTHLLRPTWHFIAAEDLRWMLALSGPRVHQANAFPYRRMELDAKVFRKSNLVLTKELGAALDRAGMDIRPNRLAYLLMRAELDGVVVSGERRGKHHTYVLFEERVAPAAAIDRDEALQRLALLYFPTRGPASAHDFAWWSGLTLKDVRRAIDIASHDLEQIVIDDRDHWVGWGIEPPANAKRSARRPSTRARSSSEDSPVAHLLPVYDEFFIGLKDRSALGGRLSGAVRATLGAGIAPQFAFVNGELVARWKRTIGAKQLVVEVEPLTRISAAEKKLLAAEAEKLAEFMEMPLELRHGAIAR